VTAIRVRPTLSALIWLFLKLGAIGFGGGMAVIALLEHELVQRRALMSSEEFLHGTALGQILGSFATNSAFFVGYRFFGIAGGLSCAAAFMVPSVALVILLSWLYFTFHAIPSLQMALLGLSPVVIALILSAAWSMSRQAVRSWTAGFLAVTALALSLFKVNSLIALSMGAVVGLWVGKDVLSGKSRFALRKHPQGFALLGAMPVTAAPVIPTLIGVTWTFLKMGLMFFGGGFVLVPVLHHLLVVQDGWLTPREFLDGVAISNLTPGPIAVLATFAGYRVHGVLGALVATLALFAPSMLLMGVLSHFYSRMKNLRYAQDMLAGLSPAMVGLILGAAILLAPGAMHGLPSLALFVAALILLLRFRWHPSFVIALGALVGMVGWAG
jgi:chromate transporter